MKRSTILPYRAIIMSELFRPAVCFHVCLREDSSSVWRRSSQTNSTDWEMFWLIFTM